jgi:Flp pilus assembly protein TadG
MIRQAKRNARADRRRGTAMVEMALVLPIFFTVVLGIVEFGRAMMVGQMITNAAREGTRMGILDGETNTTVTTWIESFLKDSINVSAADVTVTITVDPATGNPDPVDQIGNALSKDLVTIKVSVPFDKVSYIPGDYLSGKSLSAQSAMRHE